MKKSIIVRKKDSNLNNISLFGTGENLLFSKNASLIDLPRKIGEILVNGGKIRFKAISWCMFPIIWAGDTLKIESIRPEDARIGDIVLYKSTGRAYAHRLVKIYKEKDRLYIVTSGEKAVRNNSFQNCAGVPAENILGKVIEVKRGKLSFNPYKVKFGLISLLHGKLRIFLGNLKIKLKQDIIDMVIKLQRKKIWRYFLTISLRNKVSYFVGISSPRNTAEISNPYLYYEFNEFTEDDFKNANGLYHICARIRNKVVGNVSLFIETINDHKICSLFNFVLRTRFKGGGIEYQIFDKAISLSDKMKVDEVKIILSEEDKLSIEDFKKNGFEVREESY